jgi:hypothetical protein
LLEGAPDALRLRALAAALFLFLSAKKLVIRTDKLRAEAALRVCTCIQLNTQDLVKKNYI